MPTMLFPLSSAIRPQVPLSLLLDEPEFGAQLLVPSDEDPAAVAAVREIHFALAIVIELIDPTPYLTPGDLLLITGLGLPRNPADISEYVERVKGSGAVALVFGLEPIMPDVPEALVTACRERSLPLVQLPPPVYFASIVTFVTRALESERTRSLSAMVTAAQHLTEATMQPHPAQRILSALARDCGGWAVLRNGDGTSTAGALPDDLGLESLLSALALRLESQLGQGGTPTAFTTVSVRGVEHEVTAHGVRTPRHGPIDTGAMPILALGKTPRITSSDRTVLLLAANLAGFVGQMPAEQSMAVDELLMHFLVASGTGVVTGQDHARVVDLLANALGPDVESVHGVVAERMGDHEGLSIDAPGLADIAWLRRLLRTPFIERRGRRLRSFTAHPPGPQELEQAAALGWRLAISRARGLADLPHAMHEAEELSRTARRLGRHIAGHDPMELSRVWPLAAIIDPTLSSTAASLWLAPLDGADYAEERAILAAWLRRHGSWDRTARDLGLHRNTVRRLVASAGKQLGRDLEDPIERARLLLALAVTDPEY